MYRCDSGLEPSTSISDRSAFSELCQSEFNINADIASTKRLGQLKTDKIQPLLVTLNQVDQAQQLIGSARRLRQSKVAAIRDHVYINPNQTKAEAEAAYQLRVERRLKKQRRSESSTDHHSGRPTHAGHNEDGQTTTTAESDSSSSTIHANATQMSGLNAAASVYVPINLNTMSEST